MIRILLPEVKDRVNAVDAVIGDMRQHIAQPSFGVNSFHHGRPDQRRWRCRAMRARRRSWQSR